MRFSLAAMTVLFAASTACSQTYSLEGQITSGASLFPSNGAAVDAGFDEFGLPDGGYPVDYNATLVVDNSDWSFVFNASDAEETVVYFFGTTTFTGGTSTQSLEVSANSVVLNYNDIHTDYRLTLDVEGNGGSWSWANSCPECDLHFSLPRATATVTAVSVVPEPQSFGLLALGGSAMGGLRRRVRTRAR